MKPIEPYLTNQELADAIKATVGYYGQTSSAGIQGNVIKEHLDFLLKQQRARSVIILEEVKDE